MWLLSYFFRKLLPITICIKNIIIFIIINVINMITNEFENKYY